MTVTSQTAAESAGTRAAKWAPLAVILCGTFIYVLDFFVVNVALPNIQRSLHAGSAAVEWVVAGYGLTSASFLVCGGRLGDHYGRRRLFMAGVAAAGGQLMAACSSAQTWPGSAGARSSGSTCRSGSPPSPPRPAWSPSRARPARCCSRHSSCTCGARRPRCPSQGSPAALVRRFSREWHRMA
jgi:hypothetical protein